MFAITDFLIMLIAINAFKANTLFAICPACTVAVGMGVGVFHHLGIDDTITGLWLGALTASLIGWTVTWLTKRGIKFLGRKPLIAAMYLLFTLWPLYHWSYIGNLDNVIWGYDKVLFGFWIGIIIFTVCSILYTQLKKRHGGHAYFPFQKVIVPVITLTLTSIFLYFLTR